MENTNTHGSIRVSDEVIAGIALRAAKEVDGVSAVSPRFLENAVNFVKTKGKTVHGVGIVVTDGALDLTLYIAVKFGSRVPDVCVAVQDSVLEAVSDMTGFSVSAVNVVVVGVTPDAAVCHPENK